MGKADHPAAACFQELDDALTALGRPDVALNAHAFPAAIPPGAVVYNLEHVPLQISPYAFRDREIWDYSARNVRMWQGIRKYDRKVTHVPVGHHRSMERFAMRPWDERDIDVLFAGCLTERRANVLNALYDEGLSVMHLGPGTHYGKERDELLSRSKLVLNILIAKDRPHPVLRSAHLVANRVPMLAEWAPEMPRWVSHGCQYQDIVSRCLELMRQSVRLTDMAEDAYFEFCKSPMELPS